MEVIENIAHITCACGAKIQVINANSDDWDESATSNAYELHQESCTAK